MNKYRFLGEQETEQEIYDYQYRVVKDNDSFVYIEALQEVLLKVIHRIMSFAEEDPKLNEIYNFGENTITKNNIFSIPKLL